MGGCDDDDKPHSSVDLYDCYKKTWTKVSDIRKSRQFPAVVVCTFENKQELFVLCGLFAGTSVESCELGRAKLILSFWSPSWSIFFGEKKNIYFLKRIVS